MAVMEAERTEASADERCQALARSGDRCKRRARDNGWCAVHDPESDVDFAELGRKGAQASANAKRARAKSEAAKTTTAREIVRSAFASDEEWQAAVITAYRKPVIEGDMTEAQRAADALINQIEGKPQQNIQTKTDVTITVVSRLDAALETHADIELPESAVAELEA